MAEPFIGEIRLFANNFAPQGWALCNGQILSIANNQPLFSLLGTTYGGNGTTTFALPDLRGRVPVHFGLSIPLGESAGESSHTLTINEMPMHNHLVSAADTGAVSVSPAGKVWANSSSPYATPANLITMNSGSVSNAGNGEAHSNMQPYLAVNFCIATTGIYPTRN